MFQHKQHVDRPRRLKRHEQDEVLVRNADLPVVIARAFLKEKFSSFSYTRLLNEWESRARLAMVKHVRSQGREATPEDQDLDIVSNVMRRLRQEWKRSTRVISQEVQEDGEALLEALTLPKEVPLGAAEAAGLVDPGPSPDQMAEAGDRRSMVRAALSRLDPPDRELVVWTLCDRRPLQEWTTKYGLSRQEARTRLKQLKERLWGELEDVI